MSAIYHTNENIEADKHTFSNSLPQRSGAINSCNSFNSLEQKLCEHSFNVVNSGLTALVRSDMGGFMPPSLILPHALRQHMGCRTTVDCVQIPV